MTESAHAYARKAKAPFIRLGSGLSRYGNGAMNCRAINVALPAVVGAWQHLVVAYYRVLVVVSLWVKKKMQQAQGCTSKGLMLMINQVKCLQTHQYSCA
ncbi:MAG: hypothetical protein ACLUPK_05180 [Veillonella sp.]